MKNFFSDTLSTFVAFGLFYVMAFRGLFPVVNGQSLPVTVTNPETQVTTQQVITAFTGFNTIHFVYAFLLATIAGSFVAFGLRYVFQGFDFTFGLKNIEPTFKIKLPFRKKFNSGQTKEKVKEALKDREL